MNLPPRRFSVGAKDRQEADADDVAGDVGKLRDGGTGRSRRAGLLPTERVVRADAEVIDDALVDERVGGDAVVREGLIDGGAVAEVADADVRVELLEIVIAGLRVDAVGPQRRAGAGRAEKVVRVARPRRATSACSSAAAAEPRQVQPDGGATRAMRRRCCARRRATR